MKSKHKIIYFAPQPGPYYEGLFRLISKCIDLDFTVCYKNELATKKPTYDHQFDRKIKWDISLLKGYNYFFVKKIFSFVKKIKKEKPDIIILNSWSSIFDWFILFYCKILKSKIFLRNESPLNQELKKSKIKIWFKKILFNYILFPNIQAFLFIGKENKKFYEFYGAPSEKMFFTPYSVDNRRFQKSHDELISKKVSIKNKLNIKKNEKIILFVGKLIDKKRPLDLLKAFKKLKSNQTHLIYVGSGKLENKLKKYRNNKNLKNVHFLGFKNQTELPKYYIIADLFVLPSGLGETWGLVVNEAMNFSLPIITSKTVGSSSDLVKENKNGFTFKEGGILELSNKLEELIESKEKRQKFSRKSFEIIQKYNYSRDVKGIKKALSNCFKNEK